MKIRIAGMALFLCIPLVLYLYLAQPLGVLPSLGLGVLIMIGHRFLASPFSARHRPRRCLWCGRSIPIAQVSLALPVQGGKEISYKFCPPSSADCRVRWIGLHRLVLRHKHLIQFGIFIPVLAYLVLETARGAGHPQIPHEVSLALFKGIIAATVVSVSFGYLSHRPEEDNSIPPPAPFPFPLHNLSLLGAGWTLWIFRIVGMGWILQLINRMIRIF